MSEITKRVVGLFFYLCFPATPHISFLSLRQAESIRNIKTSEKNWKKRDLFTTSIVFFPTKLPTRCVRKDSLIVLFDSGMLANVARFCRLFSYVVVLT